MSEDKQGMQLSTARDVLGPQDDIQALIVDLGARFGAENQERADRRELERKADRVRTGIEHAGVPLRYRVQLMNRSLDPGYPTMVVARRFWEHTRCQDATLVLAGGVGAGKSVAAAWLFARALDADGRHIEPGAKPFWLSPQGLMDAMMDKEIAKHLARTRLPVVIDDLASEYADEKGFNVNTFQRLIAQRYDAMLCTIVCTNVDAKKAAEVYGERVMDRIKEQGWWQNFNGASRRLLRPGDLREAV